MPSEVGQNEVTAVQQVRSAGIAGEAQCTSLSPGTAAGIVYRQDPPPGTAITPGYSVGTDGRTGASVQAWLYYGEVAC